MTVRRFDEVRAQPLRPVLGSLIEDLSDPGQIRQLAEAIDSNFRRIENRSSFTDEPGLSAIASLLGGIYIEEDLETGADTAVEHSVGRALNLVVMFVDLDGLGGVVYGHPDGGAAPLNQAPWTATTVVLRSSRDGRFGVVVI